MRSQSRGSLIMAAIKQPYKIEDFIQSLLFAGSTGVNPQEIALKLKVNNISKYAYNLNKKGITTLTTANYKIANLHNAQLAFELLNKYRRQRGASTIPIEFFEEWI
jgi:hypothetical protein